MSELVWRALPGVRRGERPRFSFFFWLAALLSAAGTLGLAGSEALFLDGLGPAHLPVAFVGASLATLAGSVLYAAVVGRARNDRLFVVLLAGTAASLAIDLVLLQQGSRGVLGVLFATFYISQAVFVSLHYWTFATDYFDTLSSKRLFPLLAVGASLGGMLGGAVAVGVSRLFSAQALILAWALVLAAAAVHVGLARPRLLRWAPVGAAEADESSVEGLRGALRYLGRSPMAAWLMVSVIGMVFSLTLMQYLYLDVFSRSFETTEQLATFFGAYLAVTNGIEILVGNALTPWLIRRFGVAQANLAHPLLTLASFLWLAIDPRLATAVLARADRELLENALAGPVRALSYNALPHRFRGRMRALLEGVVFFASMSLAGAALVALGPGADARWLVALGAAGAILYAAANGFVRRAYLHSLVDELRHGRLDLDAVAGTLDSRELGRLARPWSRALAEEPGRVPTALLDLAGPLAAGGSVAAVTAHAHHPDPRVRGAVLAAVEAADVPDADALLAEALRDPDRSVRRIAARLATRHPAAGRLRDPLLGLLDDADCEVRADAALALGRDGTDTLVAMARSAEPEAVVAALARLPASEAALARRLVEADRPEVRAAAIACTARLGLRDAVATDRLVEALHHGDARVRRAAAFALARRSEPAATEALGRALDDASRAVRQAARAALGLAGDAGVLAAAPYARAPRIWTAEAALGAVAEAGGPLARAILRQCFAERVREAWVTRVAVARCADDPGLAGRFLHVAFEDAHRRARHLALRTLERIEDPAVVRSVVRALDREGPRARADALEVLSNLGEREVAQRLALLLEDGPLDDALPGLAGFVTLPSGRDEVLALARAADDRWLRGAAARYGDGPAGQEPPRSAATAPEEEDSMERLLALRRVPLFAHLTLEQLDIVNRLLQESRFLAGEVIVREGEPASDLFVLVEGQVGFHKAWGTPAEEHRGLMDPVGYFGEIAILDDAPRSATVVATRDARLLTLGSARFKELILQSPEIAFEIFPVLTARIRTAESRITDLKAGG